MDIKEIPPFDEVMKASEPSDDEVLPIWEIAANMKSNGDRFPIGIDGFTDAMGGGLKEGDLVVISGKPGSGKTTFAQTLTYHLTKRAIPCLWFSYEVVLERINRQFLEMGIKDHYNAYAPKQNTSGKIEWLKSKIREGWMRYATKVVFIDHIDFLTPDEIRNSDTREIALKKIAIALKSLAIELRVVIVIMAHVHKMQDRLAEPDLEDIGYSAGISQLADYVFMVSRIMVKGKSAMSGQVTGDLATNESRVRIVKNRETGKLIFQNLLYADGKLNEIAHGYDDLGEDAAIVS